MDHCNAINTRVWLATGGGVVLVGAIGGEAGMVGSYCPYIYIQDP